MAQEFMSAAAEPHEFLGSFRWKAPSGFLYTENLADKRPTVYNLESYFEAFTAALSVPSVLLSAMFRPAGATYAARRRL